MHIMQIVIFLCVLWFFKRCRIVYENWKVENSRVGRGYVSVGESLSVQWIASKEWRPKDIQNCVWVLWYLVVCPIDIVTRCNGKVRLVDWQWTFFGLQLELWRHWAWESSIPLLSPPEDVFMLASQRMNDNTGTSTFLKPQTGPKPTELQFSANVVHVTSMAQRNIVSLNRNQRAFNNNFCFRLQARKAKHFCHAEAVVIWWIEISEVCSEKFSPCVYDFDKNCQQKRIEGKIKGRRMVWEILVMLCRNINSRSHRFACFISDLLMQFHRRGDKHWKVT